jgi:hypothetical protein
LPVLETESIWKLLKPFVLGQEFNIPAVDDNALFNRTIFFRCFFCCASLLKSSLSLFNNSGEKR